MCFVCEGHIFPCAFFGQHRLQQLVVQCVTGFISPEFTDDGVTQVATINVGVAVKADALVPNPVELIPFRTFQEVDQPASKFVFRVGNQEVPTFKLVEAENSIWKNQAIENVKRFLRDALPEEFRRTIPIIG